MLIVGAGGVAKEVLEIYHQLGIDKELYFYDDVSNINDEQIFNRFNILTSMEQAEQLFITDNRFSIAVGKPAFRFLLYNKFVAAGGKCLSAISPLAHIGHYEIEIGNGSIIMAGTVITSNVKIGMGCLINPNCTISHDCIIGDFVEISPGVNITGKCSIGNNCSIGTGAVILPGVIIGNNAVIGAGAVVTKNVAEGLTVVGVPAQNLIKK
jgi:sugar O-acyltransferase (sialic acid O-acetyltransferase NeuD family)